MKQNKVPKNEYIRKPVGKTNPYKHDVDYVSRMGYRDDSPFNDRPYIDIHTPSGMIDMSNTGIPLMANGMYLPPYSGMHQFEPGIVREQKIPMAQDGLQATPTYASGKEQNSVYHTNPQEWLRQNFLANKAAKQTQRLGKFITKAGSYLPGAIGVPLTAGSIIDNLEEQDYPGTFYDLLSSVPGKAGFIGKGLSLYNDLSEKAYGGDIEQESEIEEPSTNPKTGETIKSKKEQYQDKIKNNYQSYLESVNNITPYTPTTKEGHMNCIHGVCTVIEGTGAKKFTQEYTGNMTFADARKKEGFYEVDPSKEGFEIGDIIQYARTKSKAASMGRFNTSNSLTPVNKDDLIPQHAKIILNKYIDEDGITRYVVGHNGGEDTFFITPDSDNGDVKEETLLKHYKKGYNTYDGLIVNRYDPDFVDKIEGEKKAELDIIKGKNNYASLYNISPKITIKKEIYDTNLNKKVVEDFGKSKELLDYYKKNYRKLGKTANMPPYLLNQLFHNQIGIAEQESKTGEDLGTKRFVPEVFLPTVRKLKDAVSSSEDWVKDYWSKNANNVKANYKSIEDFKNHLNKNNKLSKEAREYMFYNSPKSKGIFQQKELSKRGRVLGSNFDTPENQFLSSMYLAIDNYHLLKNKYPDLSENELIDLTTLMHNAPGKALTKEYVDYYLKNNDIDYVNKVKEQRGILEQPATKYLEKMQDLNKQKVTTKEIADIKKFLQKLPSNRYGGNPSLPNITGHYQKGGWLDELDEEYRRGGSVNPLMRSRSKRASTKKNIQSSINKIFLRNYDLFGPGGKNIYDPKAKYQQGGGWLDNLD